MRPKQVYWFQIITQTINHFCGMKFEFNNEFEYFENDEYRIEESKNNEFNLYRLVYETDTGAHSEKTIAENLDLSELCEAINKIQNDYEELQKQIEDDEKNF